jgi:integrase
MKRGGWGGRSAPATATFPTNPWPFFASLIGSPPAAAAQKQDSDQVFPLVKETVEALRAIDPSRNRMIFGDWPFNRSTLRKRLKVMLVKAGLYPSIKAIPKRTELFHKLRKTIATAVKKRDGKEAATALCGHSSGFVTDFYIDKSQTGDGPDCRGALSELLVSPPPPPPEPVDRQLRLFALYYSAALSLAEPVSAALEWITAAI